MLSGCSSVWLRESGEWSVDGEALRVDAGKQSPGVKDGGAGIAGGVLENGMRIKPPWAGGRERWKH